MNDKLFRTITALAALGLGLFVSPQGARGQDLDARQRERLYYSVKPGVVLVDVNVVARVEVAGQSYEKVVGGGTGSGWIISPDGYVVTNGHVVEDYHDSNDREFIGKAIGALLQEVEQRLGRKLQDDEKKRIVRSITAAGLVKNISVVLQNGKKYAAELKEYSPPISRLPGKVFIAGESDQEKETGKDVAILKIEGHDLPTVRLGDSERMQIGDQVHVAGYPGVVASHQNLNAETALEASFTRGQVSSLKLDVKGASVIQMDAAITWGNSGGPVFNDQGEVIGMATFISIHNDDRGGQAIQGFNFAVPSNVVREFIRAAGVDMRRGVFDKTWDQALNYYYAGQWAPAIEMLDESLRLVPNLRDALQLRTRAIEARGVREPLAVDTTSHRGVDTTTHSTPVTLWIVAGVAGLALLVAGALVLRRRSRVEPKAAPTAAATSTNGDRSLGKLVVREGPLQGNQFPLTARGVKIGRDPRTCQIVLSEDTVSREHAVITLGGDDSEVVIKNLSGTNATYVNNRAIQEATLRAGDQIRVGSSVLTFEPDFGGLKSVVDNRIFAHSH